MHIRKKVHSPDWRATEFTLASAKLHSPVRCIMWVYFSNLTVARLASNFEFTLANENLHSPWRYGDAYVHPCKYANIILWELFMRMPINGRKCVQNYCLISSRKLVLECMRNFLKSFLGHVSNYNLINWKSFQFLHFKIACLYILIFSVVY